MVDQTTAPEIAKAREKLVKLSEVFKLQKDTIEKLKTAIPMPNHIHTMNCNTASGYVAAKTQEIDTYTQLLGQYEKTDGSIEGVKSVMEAIDAIHRQTDVFLSKNSFTGYVADTWVQNSASPNMVETQLKNNEQRISEIIDGYQQQKKSLVSPPPAVPENVSQVAQSQDPSAVSSRAQIYSDPTKSRTAASAEQLQELRNVSSENQSNSTQRFGK